VVHQRETPGVYVAAGILGTQNAGAGIAGEQKSKIGVEPCLLRDGLLGDGIKPIVGKTGTELLARISGGKFNIHAGREGWHAQGPIRFVEVPFDAEVSIAGSARGLRSRRTEDGEIGRIEI